MRRDMHKVIVERPRRLTLGLATRKGRPARDGEDLPSREAIKRPYTVQSNWRGKELSDHLTPLRRYLLKQVGRPWNKVFSEVCAQARLDSVVQRHLRQHVLQLVDTTPKLGKDGKPSVSRITRAPYLYVDPRNGLLQLAKARLRR